MRFWLSRQSDVSIHDQLVKQVVLGILSEDLAPGQRLPSTRDLARRFKVHANTISAAYGELEEEGWLESRRGSGVYVAKRRAASASHSADELDRLMASLFRSARKLGVPLMQLRARIADWLAAQPPDHFLLIEPDPDLSRIAVVEITAAVTFPVSSADFKVCADPARLA